jgi:hypothetical protein
MGNWPFNLTDPAAFFDISITFISAGTYKLPFRYIQSSITTSEALHWRPARYTVTSIWKRIADNSTAASQDNGYSSCLGIGRPKIRDLGKRPSSILLKFLVVLFDSSRHMIWCERSFGFSCACFVLCWQLHSDGIGGIGVLLNPYMCRRRYFCWKKSPRKLAQAVKFLTWNLKVLGSNYHQETNYPNWGLSFCSSNAQANTVVPQIWLPPLPSTSLTVHYSLSLSHSTMLGLVWISGSLNCKQKNMGGINANVMSIHTKPLYSFIVGSVNNQRNIRKNVLLKINAEIIIVIVKR